MSDLIIWGTGGHAKVVVSIARSVGLYRSIAFIDDDPGKRGAVLCLSPILGTIDDLIESEAHFFMVAIGNNRIRALCYSKARSTGLGAATLIHPSAVIDASVVIGCGSVVMPGVLINADARIGENCILNTGCIVEHDCTIGDHAHISPGAALGGGTRIGPYAHVGILASILPGMEIGEGATVGAGSVVREPVRPYFTVVGVPARALPRS